MTARVSTNTSPCSLRDAKTRLRLAESYQEVAEAVLTDKGRPADLNYDHVAGGLAVLAAIAASDAICCGVLGFRSRGQDHREAVGVLASAAFGPETEEERSRRARNASKVLAQVLSEKDEACYASAEEPNPARPVETSDIGTREYKQEHLWPGGWMFIPAPAPAS